MSDEPTVESVARELRDLPLGTTMASMTEAIARYHLRERNRAVREALEGAARALEGATIKPYSEGDVGYNSGIESAIAELVSLAAGVADE